MGLLRIHGDAFGRSDWISTRYVAGEPPPRAITSFDWALTITRPPDQIAVVNDGGALLRTRSVTSPLEGSTSPASASPWSVRAVNSNDGGVANPSTAT